MDVAMENSLVNLTVSFLYILWLKLTSTTEQRMLPVPLANGKRRGAKRLIKPHRVRQAERSLTVVGQVRENLFFLCTYFQAEAFEKRTDKCHLNSVWTF